MTANDVLAKNTQNSWEWMKWIIGDFSDADLLARSCAGANHVNWQLGHLLLSTNSMMAALGAKSVELPAGFAEMYKKDTAAIDDPAKFAKKDQLIALLDQVHQEAVRAIKAMSAADFAKDSPEGVKSYAPTLADLASLFGQHAFMHMGQFQVTRRKLGKPVLM